MTAPWQRRPSVAWYWIAGAVGVAGLAGAAAIGVGSVLELVNQPAQFPRAPIPGEVSVQLAEPAGRIIFYEADDIESVPEFGVTVTGPSGQDVPVRPYSAELTYDVPGRRGTALVTFDGPVPGEYVVTTRGTVPGANIAVGDSFVDRLGPLFTAVGIGLGSLILAAVITAVTAIRRGRPPQMPAGV